MSTWQLVGVILASAALWMHYVHWKDSRQPEPRRRLVLAFGLGVVAWVIAVLGFMLLDAMGLPDIKFGDAKWNLIFCFLIVGPVEEGAKLLVALLFVFRWREFDEPLDGFVYAAAISFGFASVENFHNLPMMGWPDQLARTAALPITHCLFGAIWGFGIGHARFCVSQRSHRLAWQAGSIGLGMFAHGLYDFVLFTYQATFVTSGLALAIWIFVIWRARVCAKYGGAASMNIRQEDAGHPVNPVR